MYIRTVLIRNNRWYFLNPVGFAIPDEAARANPGAVSGSRWPLLAATRRCSHYCHYQVWRRWRGPGAGRGGRTNMGLFDSRDARGCTHAAATRLLYDMGR